MIKLFLQGFKDKKSINTSEGLNISLKGKRKLLPTNDIAEVVSAYDVYREEREKCNKIRLTLQVNTVCSNVLFNSITEIVKNEGSSAMSFINYRIIDGEISESAVTSEPLYFKDNNVGFWSDSTVKEAIRDTQLTNFGYVYHCGADIFNNHLVRSNTFKSVCAPQEIGPQEVMPTTCTTFNTIEDMLRSEEKGENNFGITERIYFPLSSGLASRGQTPKSLHLYKYDDLYTYKECIENRLIKSFEGWVGFHNKSKIKTYINYGKDDQQTLNIDRPIMYLNGGDFVDMYPDRTLYSFTPKYNTYKNRLEKNWNYCLTYPSSSTTKGFEDIIQTNNNSLKAIYFNENTIADNGIRQLVIYSIAKHGLSIGDTVNIYNTNSDGVTELVLSNAKVTAIADDFIFTVFSTVQIGKYWVEITDAEFISDKVELDIGNFELYNNKYFLRLNGNGLPDTKTKYYIIDGTNYVNFDDNAQNISYKKVVNGIECDYYVRIFSRLPNFKNASADTSNEYEIYKPDASGKTIISEYQQRKYEHESHVSKLAFAKNSYSDDIAEIVFTDDIDISNLKDNLGRPLSSIYLTIVKNNAGYKEWYGFDVNTWDVTECLKDNVEFSHCFGSVMCGIQTSEESKYDDNIRSINKINPLSIDNVWGPRGYDIDNINGDRDDYDEDDNYSIETDEVWFNLDRHYYGDLCYYDNYNAIEKHIQPILHRFNTAQRESKSSSGDSYFKQFSYDEIKHDDYDYNGFSLKENTTIQNCNSKKEGYYYNPHYEIKVKSFDKVETAMPDFLTITQIEDSKESSILKENEVRFRTLEQPYLSIGDKVMVYDIPNKKYYYCEMVSATTTPNIFICVMYDENNNQIMPYDVFRVVTINTVNDQEEKIYGNDRSKDDFTMFKIDNLDIPSYARVLRDGTCRMIWRKIVNNGFNMSDDSIEEYPFTNGAFYINKPINLYVKRQDPYDIWGLYSSDDLIGAEINTEEEDNYVKDSDIEC